jgi:hypothetical protein
MGKKKERSKMKERRNMQNKGRRNNINRIKNNEIHDLCIGTRHIETQ